jgi:hypothetical protein
MTSRSEKNMNSTEHEIAVKIRNAVPVILGADYKSCGGIKQDEVSAA